MSDDTTERTTLSNEEFARIEDLVENPPAPTPYMIEAARRYRERVANGSITVEDDDAETMDWARKGFAELGFEFDEAGKIVGHRSAKATADGIPEDPEVSAANAEGYDPDVVLAQHLLHDCGTITPFVEDTLSAEEVERARADMQALNAEISAASEARGRRPVHPRVAAIKAGTAIDWDTDDDRLISDCGRYEITEDVTYGFAALHIDGTLETEHASAATLKRLAQEHKDRG